MHTPNAAMLRLECFNPQAVTGRPPARRQNELLSCISFSKKLAASARHAALAQASIADLGHEVVEVIEASLDQVAPFLFGEDVVAAFLLFGQVFALHLLRRHAWPLLLAAFVGNDWVFGSLPLRASFSWALFADSICALPALLGWPVVIVLIV